MLIAYVICLLQPMVGVFGPACYNLKRHTHLSIPVRPGGDPRLWPHWMFNIQTKGYEPDSVWSHRLGITGKGELGGGWEECLVRASAFSSSRPGASAADRPALSVPFTLRRFRSSSWHTSLVAD